MDPAVLARIQYALDMGILALEGAMECPDDDFWNEGHDGFAAYTAMADARKALVAWRAASNVSEHPVE